MGETSLTDSTLWSIKVSLSWSTQGWRQLDCAHSHRPVALLFFCKSKPEGMPTSFTEPVSTIWMVCTQIPTSRDHKMRITCIHMHRSNWSSNHRQILYISFPRLKYPAQKLESSALPSLQILMYIYCYSGQSDQQYASWTWEIHFPPLYWGKSLLEWSHEVAFMVFFFQIKWSLLWWIFCSGKVLLRWRSLEALCIKQKIYN